MIFRVFVSVKWFFPLPGSMEKTLRKNAEKFSFARTRAAERDSLRESERDSERDPERDSARDPERTAC